MARGRANDLADAPRHLAELGIGDGSYTSSSPIWRNCRVVTSAVLWSGTGDGIELAYKATVSLGPAVMAQNVV
jgi:hypothetical protein